jgi:serine/threonine-protein kinase
MIPGYLVEGVLGSGGMGVVFKAKHLQLNRTVALKMAHIGTWASRGDRERFQREAEAVASLTHPNIVQVFDVDEADGRPYFTMEFLDGGNLAQQIAGTPQPAARASQLVATLASAVHSAHAAGVIHRDLKPANVLLTQEGTPKVSDFGIARRLGGGASLTRTGALIGTPSYMAPEQARGIGGKDVAVDVYALGAILYELLTGRPPFLADTAAQTIYQVLSQDPVAPSKLAGKVPRDLETICLKCLHKEPRLRYPSAHDLMQDLNRFERGIPVQARRLGWAARTWRWSRRRPAGAALIVLAIAMLGTSVGVARWLEQEALSRREEVARTEGRSSQAVAAALQTSNALLKQGRWIEAKTTLDSVKNLMGTATAARLHQQVLQGIADAEMVSDLEEIRLKLSSDAIPNFPKKMYADAFRKYGLDLNAMKPVDATQRIHQSAIKDTLLAFMHDWLYWASGTDRDNLNEVLDQADDNAWRREFRSAAATQDFAKMRNLAKDHAAARQSPIILSGLAGSLLSYQQRDEACTLLSAAQRLYPNDFWINYLLGHFWDRDRPQLAVGYFRAAVAVRPSSEQAYILLGRALKNAGENEEAISAFRIALTLNPKCVVGREYPMALAEIGDLVEAQAAWADLLESHPNDHAAWHGYPELCVFLNNDEAYLSARAALLNEFEHTEEHWTIPERTSLWCLLRPASDRELERIANLVDRLTNSGPKAPHPDFAYVQYVQGLLKLRQGRPQEAIELLQNSTAVLTNRPGPRLAWAMAQFESGSTEDARETLAEARRSFDWKNGQGDLPTLWASIELRHQAEQLITPP